MTAASFIGAPLRFSRSVEVFSPTVREVCANPAYGQYVSLLTQSQEDIWDRIVEDQRLSEWARPKSATTPFETLLIFAAQSPESAKTVTDAITFFVKQPVKLMLESKMILFAGGLAQVKRAEDLEYLDDENFIFFQNFIRAAIGEEEVQPPDLDELPQISKIKAKGRLRDRILQQKGGPNSISMKTMLVAVCCMQLGITPLTIGEMPYPAVSELFRMAMDREKYNIDLQLIAGGADSKKINPKHWTKGE